MIENDLFITTGVDKLIELVKEKGKIDISLASKLLHIPVHQIEDWARVLEDAGIISIEYHLTHVFLVWKAPTYEEIVEEKS